MKHGTIGTKFQEVPSTMLTEKILHDNPVLLKAFTGLPADTYWQLGEVVGSFAVDAVG